MDENEATFDERRKFGASEHMRSVFDAVEKRLGLTGLDDDQMKLLYNLCRFEEAFRPSETSAWCAAFSTEDLKVLEYFEDLKYYYKNGYATDINYRMSCPLVKDMATAFNGNRY